MSNLKSISYEFMIIAMENYIKKLKSFAEENPEEAKIIARKTLIETGVLNNDGSQKENIVTEPHVGNPDDLVEYYAEYNKNEKKYAKQRIKRKNKINKK